MAELVVVEDGRKRRLLFETGPDGSVKGTSQVGVGDWLKDSLHEPSAAKADEIGSAIVALAEAVTGSFDGLATDKADGGKLSELKVHFGIKVSAEGNMFVTKAGAEANLTVSLEWDFS